MHCTALDCKLNCTALQSPIKLKPYNQFLCKIVVVWLNYIDNFAKTLMKIVYIEVFHTFGILLYYFGNLGIIGVILDKS